MGKSPKTLAAKSHDYAPSSRHLLASFGWVKLWSDPA